MPVASPGGWSQRWGGGFELEAAVSNMARFYLLSVFIWGDFCLLGDVTVFYRLLSSLLTGWILNAYAAGGTKMLRVKVCSEAPLGGLLLWHGQLPEQCLVAHVGWCSGVMVHRNLEELCFLPNLQCQVGAFPPVKHWDVISSLRNICDVGYGWFLEALECSALISLYFYQ